jgi:hypothetical protein
MNQPAEIVVLTAGMRQIRANLTIAKSTAQRDEAAQNPCQEDIAATRTAFGHESSGRERAGPDHVGDYRYGSRR